MALADLAAAEKEVWEEQLISREKNPKPNTTNQPTQTNTHTHQTQTKKPTNKTTKQTINPNYKYKEIVALRILLSFEDSQHLLSSGPGSRVLEHSSSHACVSTGVVLTANPGAEDTHELSTSYSAVWFL